MKKMHGWLAGLAMLCLGLQAQGGELEVRAAIEADIGAAFARGDYRHIEERYAAALAQSERTPSGLDVSNLIRIAVVPPAQGQSQVPGRDDHWLPVEQKLDAWARQFPQSSLVASAQSWAYVSHGWSWRGGGFARTVRPEDFKKLEVYVQRAYDALMARQQQGRKDPGWYVQMLAVARLQGWDRKRYLDVASEATHTFPVYNQIYFEIGRKLQPRWGGSLREIAKLAEIAVEQSRKTEGQSLYARIYWDAGEALDVELSDPAVDWKRVRAGFEDLLKRYPDSWNLNNYARMACEARDFDTAKRLLGQVQDRLERTAWHDRASYLRCMAAAGIKRKPVAKSQAALAAPAAAAAAAKPPAKNEPLTAPEQVYGALEAGRYQEVEDYYAKLRKERKRGADGDFLFEDLHWKMYWYSSSDPKEGASHWPNVDAATRAWVAHSPGSYLAAMNRAFVLAYRAGHLLARDGDWGKVDQLTAEARQLLERSRRAGAGDALWHATRLRVASVEGAPRSEVVDMIHAGAKADPYPMRLWLEAAIALSPDGRNATDLVWLMRTAAQRTARSEGTSMYARVLDTAYWHFPDFEAAPFARGGPEWDLLHGSFLDWKKRHPQGYPPQLHAALACAARDREVTASLVAQLPDGQKDIWERLGGKDYFARCKEWATARPEGPKT